MAEFVQKNIESFIPELEQMERVGLATRDQVREILRRRKRFEYRLRRRKRTKEDYLTYIQYELNLYALLQKRRARLRIAQKKLEIDLVIAKRINKLFKKAVLMFSGDCKLWLSHIDFCSRMGWNHVVGTLYTRMLNLHSHKPEIWVAAAKWQLEENASVEMSRKLLQRGLLFNNKSCVLWREYFRMELIFVDKMRKRKEVLGIKEEKDGEAAAMESVLTAKIPSLVYQAAVKAIPDVDFALSFLPACAPFKFARPLEEMIVKDLQDRYPNREQVWDAVARRMYFHGKRGPDLAAEEDDNEAEEKSVEKAEKSAKKPLAAALDVYRQAVLRLPTETMWKLFIQFLLDLLPKSTNSELAEMILDSVLDLMKMASKEQLLTYEHHQEWVRLLHSTGKEKRSIACARLAVQRWPKVIDAWFLLIDLLLVTNAGAEAILATFDEAFAAVPKADSLPLWERAVDWMSGACPDKLIPFLEKALFHPPNVCVYVKEKLLDIYFIQQGHKAARKFYKRMLCLKPLSLKFFQLMIDIENSNLPPRAAILRSYFEDATSQFGETSTDLWIKYILFELKHPEGKPEQAAVLYQRAVKTLHEQFTDEFIAAYSLLDPSKEEEMNT